MNHRDAVLIKSLYKAKDTQLWTEAFKSAFEDNCLIQLVDKLVEISSNPEFQLDSYQVNALLEIFAIPLNLPSDIQLLILEKLSFAEHISFINEAFSQTTFVKAAIDLKAPFAAALIEKLQYYNASDCLLHADLVGNSEIAEILRKKISGKCRQKNCTCQLFTTTEHNTKCSNCNHSRIWHQPASKPQSDSLIQ